jgi:hypothetical protein
MDEILYSVEVGTCNEPEEKEIITIFFKKDVFWTSLYSVPGMNKQLRIAQVGPRCGCFRKRIVVKHYW